MFGFIWNFLRRRRTIEPTEQQLVEPMVQQFDNGSSSFENDLGQNKNGQSNFQSLDDKPDETLEKKTNDDLKAENKIEEMDWDKRVELISSKFQGLVQMEKNFWQQFIMVKKLGQGGFGIVYQAVRKTERFAIKKINIVNEIPLSTISDEISIMKKLAKHPNIVHYFDSCIVDYKQVWIIMEYIDGATLYNICETKALTESVNHYIACELLKGIEYMHSKSIAHRDIKTSNALIGKNGSIKLIDFGISITIKPNEMDEKKKLEMAPFDSYDFKHDIWSFAYSVLQLIKSQDSIKIDNTIEMVPWFSTKQLVPSNFKSVISDQFVNFLERCMEPDLELRPMAKELLDDPFIQCCPSLESVMPSISAIFKNLNSIKNNSFFGF